MFRNRNAAGGDDQRRERRDIIGGMAVAAGSDDVDRFGRCGDPQHFRAHSADCAGDFVDGLAADSETDEKATHLRSGNIT